MFIIIIIISKQIGKGEYGFKKSKTEWTHSNNIPKLKIQCKKFNKKQKK